MHQYREWGAFLGFWEQYWSRELNGSVPAVSNFIPLKWSVPAHATPWNSPGWLYLMLATSKNSHYCCQNVLAPRNRMLQFFTHNNQLLSCVGAVRVFLLRATAWNLPGWWYLLEAMRQSSQKWCQNVWADVQFEIVSWMFVKIYLIASALKQDLKNNLKASCS